MPESIGWYHPVDESDQWDGFNEPGIETYAGSPIRSLAREVNQNSFDAGESDLVKVEVRLHKVKPSEIPNLEELQANLKACYEASKNESRKAEVFFERAISELSNREIDVLEISDYKTLGMKGPAENGTPFYAFMKAKGQSRKQSDTATGSYGIGKFAPYSVSKVRTIFVSTVYQDESNEFHQLTQGKSILMSHDIDGQRKQGMGFWGIKEKCQPIEGVCPDVPHWIQRVNSNEDLTATSKGTKLSILCFNASLYWQEYLAVSIAENFFGAIINDSLCVSIDGKFTLDKGSIKQFFARQDIREIIKDFKEEPKHFDNCMNYLATFDDEYKVIVEESEMLDLGRCQLRIIVGEGLPRKVCVLRNGMFITDSLNGIKSFSDFKEFVAVFRCLNTKGNEMLRDMEPPGHDDFEPERLQTPKERKRSVRALRSIAKWVRDMLKRHAKDPVSEVTEIDELRDFFGDEGAEGSGQGIEEINPYGELIIRAKPIKVQVPSSGESGEEAEKGKGEGSDGGGGADGAGGGDGAGGTGSGTGGTGGGAQKPLVQINNVRSVPLGKKNRRVAFTPLKTGAISLRLMEAGADTDYGTSIVKASDGKVVNGCVVLNVVAGSRFIFEVELNREFTGAVKVVAHEV